MSLHTFGNVNMIFIFSTPFHLAADISTYRKQVQNRCSIEFLLILYKCKFHYTRCKITDYRFESLLIQVDTLSYIWLGKCALNSTFFVLENHGVTCPMFSGIISYASSSQVYSPYRKCKVPTGYTCAMSEKVTFLHF